MTGVVENNTETVATEEVSQTVYEFFYDICQGTYVGHPDKVGRFIYGGTDYNDEGRQIVVLYSDRYGTQSQLTPEECGVENRWFAVTFDGDAPLDGENKVADTILLRMLRNHHSISARHDRLDEQVYDLRRDLQNATDDFRVLNDQLNDFADHGHYGKMCEEYENQLDKWNSHLEHFKLVGRPRDHWITVSVAGTTGSIRVNTTSDEQAREDVRNMTTRDVIRQMLDNGEYFDGLSVEIVGIHDEDDEDWSDDE